MVNIIAIDPGPKESAYVVMENGEITEKGIEENSNLRDILDDRLDSPCGYEHDLLIEMVASYGMAVGKDVFETCVEIGRFIEAWGGPYKLVYRKDVKMHLCGSTRAKDSNIRQALIDLYGGSKEKAIGKKANPGPLYGFKSHLWAALGVAVTGGKMLEGEQ